ncbi:hypothetical protein ACRE1U_04410 [Helicobacter himalayensis]|uniref:hypothetical protein n=1 Tax=Helicobacter himalayensis TaxID=1591088 RepID=UPI003D6FD540
MRKILFDTKEVLCDTFGAQIPLFEGENGGFYAFLPLEQGFQFGNTSFFTLKGFGDISYKDLPLCYPDFSKVNVANLDYFLQHKQHSSDDYDEIAQIENFIEFLALNKSFEKPKIYTTEYNYLLNQLLGVRNERYFKL